MIATVSSTRIHRAKAHGEDREIANLRNADEAREWLSGSLDYKHLFRGGGDDFLVVALPAPRHEEGRRPPAQDAGLDAAG